MDRFWWENHGQYEYEVSWSRGHTGWVRCASGRLADGRWPAWNSYTGQTRYN